MNTNNGSCNVKQGDDDNDIHRLDCGQDSKMSKEEHPHLEVEERVSFEKARDPNSGCSHDVQVNGMCALCGEDLSISTELFSDRRTTIELVPGSSAPMSVSVSLSEAQRLERATASRLIAARKLSLVVDLDQTLVHATTSPLVDSWFVENKLISEQLCKEMDIHRVILEDDESRLPHYIKLRNSVHGFLERISKKFELHIYTMGSHSYGSAVAKLLDHTGTLFFDRIVTRDHTKDRSIIPDWTKKELSRIFPCEDAMVLILDDRSDVWTHSPNLIHVRPCIHLDPLALDFFFSNTGDINWQQPFGSLGEHHNALKPKTDTPSTEQVYSALMEKTSIPTSTFLASLWVDGAVQKADEALLSRIESILDELHALFFRNYDRVIRRIIEGGGGDAANVLSSPSSLFGSPTCAATNGVDMKVLLPALKCRILAGVSIAFTGVIPLNIDPTRYGTTIDFHETSSEIWRRASEFGAICYMFGLENNGEIGEKEDDSIFSITHLVASNPETERARFVWAHRGSSVAIVRPQWLWDSIWSFQRQPEAPYLWNAYDWLAMNDESTLPLEEEDVDFLAQLDAEDCESYRRGKDLEDESLDSTDTSESTDLDDDLEDATVPRKRTSSQLDEEELITGSDSSDADLGNLAAEI